MCFLTEEKLLYRTLLFSVKHQQESPIGIHMSLPSWNSLPSPSPPHPSRLLQSPFEISWVLQQIPIGCLFTYGDASFHVTLSIHLTLFFLSSTPVSISLFAMYVSSLLPHKINPFHLSRFHIYIYVSIWCLYFSFWLTSLFVIGSRFIHFTRTDSNAFLFMAEVHCIYVWWLLYPFICRWTSRLLPCSVYCK